MGLLAKAVRMRGDPWFPRSLSQSIFERLSRKPVLGAYAGPTPLRWDMFLRQRLSVLLSRGFSCGV